MKKLFGLLLLFLLAIVTGAQQSSADAEPNDEERLEILNRQISFFDEGLKSKPGDPNLHFQLGTKYYELGRFYESKTDRILFSGDNAAHMKKARGLYRDSITHLKKSLQIQPRNAGAHFNISLTYLVEGDGENAISHMRESEKLFMKNNDKRGVAKSRKALREWFDRYGYRPEDFTSQ
jgi:tetratricopeptide (TPR) repeat protein